MFMVGMAFGHYQGPRAALQPGESALLSACVVQKMPPDWPGRQHEQEQATQQFEAARAIDPNFPDPAILFKPTGNKP